MKFHFRILTAFFLCFSIYSCTDYSHFAPDLIEETHITDIYPTDSLHWQIFAETIQRYARSNENANLLKETEYWMNRSAGDPVKIQRETDSTGMTIFASLSEYRNFAASVYRLYLPYCDSIRKQKETDIPFLEKLLINCRTIDSVVQQTSGINKMISNPYFKKSANDSELRETYKIIHEAFNENYNLIKEETVYHTVRFSRYVIKKIAKTYPELNKDEFDRVYEESVSGICHKLMCPPILTITNKEEFSSCIMSKNKYAYEEYLKAVKNNIQ